MLEHSAMYLNVPPQYEDDTSFFPDFYTRLGPCDLQDPVWAKMSLPSGVKKRKKSETKPQAQINKCNNEKRRREQENIYIEELAELISANFADMSSLSVKPDKCAILQETVNQIRSIKQRESASQSCDPVQQGEVSSSRPTILSNEVYGPLLLEALEGFLFVVNGDGKIEHVTENVSEFLRFTRDELYNNSIFNFLHHGDHVRFGNTIKPMTIGWVGGESSGGTRSRSFSLRFLVKPDNDSSEQQKERLPFYESMHISSTQLRDQSTLTDEEGADNGPYLLCVASRISPRDKVISNVEQFTTKLDVSGRIIGLDVPSPFSLSYLFNKAALLDKHLKDLVPQEELHRLNAHLRETVSVGHAASGVYRLHVGEGFVRVQSKYKLFKTNPPISDTDFIMATHTIVGDHDAIGPSDPGGGSAGTSTTSVGGPLMTSVLNGTRNGTAALNTANLGSDSSASGPLLAATSSSFASYNFDNDFGLDVCSTSTFELEQPNWSAAAEARPESRQSAASNPRPSSAPAYSPAPAQSPHFYGSTFSFSPLPPEGGYEEKETNKAMEESMADSGRLRILLTKPPADSSGGEGRNKHTILKGLLNQPDEDEREKGSPRRPGPSEVVKTTTAENQMLLQLLNDRSDDDDNLEARAGVKKKSELLHQLLKSENENEKKSEGQTTTQGDSLLRSLGFNSSPSPPNSEPGRGRKRHSDEREENSGNKRSSDGGAQQVTSSGKPSKLSEQNKMLASLLAKPNNNQQPIPPVPERLIKRIPNLDLPPVQADMNLLLYGRQTSPANNNTHHRQPTTNYLNNMLSNRTSNSQQQMSQVESSSYNTAPASSSTDAAATAANSLEQMWAENNNSNDPLLSDILDQVMDIVPDEVGRYTHAEGQPTSNFQNELSEKMAINNIQKLLMQCESAVKSPSSPSISLPGTPPAYTPATQNSQLRPFQPPPNYPQGNFLKQRIPVRPPNAPQYPNNTLLLQRKQQEERMRLLQQQMHQEILVPPSSTAPENNAGLQSIDSLLNNSVAPNVTLQRSASLPESQLSPNYTNQINQAAPNQQRINQQYSPQMQQQQGFGGQGNGNYQQARLSPQFNQQMALRQAYPQGGQNWQQSQQARLSMQNPMLNAQLTGSNNFGGHNGRNFQRTPQQPPGAGGVQQQTANQQQQQQPQQQRSLNSPGTVTSRHSPYQPDFPPPTSPNSAAFNQNQYLRLQRANSVPTATTQLPGGLGSPRPYGREHHPHPFPPLPPNLHQHPMMYQQDSSQYCYDQTGLQLAYNGADRGRAPPHLQPGVSASAPASEFVRQELRAVVGARTGQAQTAPPNRTQQQSQLLNQQQLDALGLAFDMPTTSGASESPKLWGAMGSDMGSMSPQPATSRSTIEEGARPGDHGNKSASLLQKLLSE